jgi:putative protease
MKPELLAPAGGYEAALAAFQYGADAVYVGLPWFSARADADNMPLERLRVLLAYARSLKPAKKVYVTFNTLVPDAEIPAALTLLEQLEVLAPDGVIVQDLGVARLIRDYFPSLELHASTQLAVHNLDGVMALKELGFKRVVLARELSCEEVKYLVAESGVEIEIFVHGALCYSYSGLCLFSAMMHQRSGNRGRCAYCCREGFSCEGEKDVRYPFSMKDLALAPVLDKVVATGAHSLKIEGRMKSPLYVACVSAYYRKKLDGTLSQHAERQMIQDLQTVFSRPWTTLYATGRSASNETIVDPVAIGHRGTWIGESDAVLQDGNGIRWLRFKTNRALEKHDGIQVELPGGGRPFGFAVHQLRITGNVRLVITAPAGASVEIALPAEENPYIPRGTSVFCSASQAVRRAYEIHSVRESELTIGTPVDFDITLHAGGIKVSAQIPQGMTRAQADIFISLALEKAQQPERTEGAIRKAFERLGESTWSLGKLTLSDPDGCYAPASKLNEARRMALAVLDETWARIRSERLERMSHEIEQAGKRSSQEQISTRTAGVVMPASHVKTLKVRCSSRNEFDAQQMQQINVRFDTLVIGLEHTATSVLKTWIEEWKADCPGLKIKLAMPLVSREKERQGLKEAVLELIREGWTAWECADMAGWHFLKESGITEISADWSLYAFNLVAVTELAKLGITSFVVSPECDMKNTCALVEAPIPAEGLIYQYIPLFISETAPCVEGASAETDLTFTDRRGNAFVSHLYDRRWVTTASVPLNRLGEESNLPFSRNRIDLSGSPRRSGSLGRAIFGMACFSQQK